VLLAVVSAALPACRTGGGTPAASDGAAGVVPPPVVEIDTPGRKVTFRVELARTSEEVQRGLMYREHLAPDAGMLFLFERPRVQTFWMKNTLIPLDMIFIGPDRRIVGIVAEAEPQTLTARKVDSPSQYVLEIGGGLAAQLGIRPGQVVEFPPGATMP
jgi:uncharacterized membrane protein (UPF0127 family)